MVSRVPRILKKCCARDILTVTFIQIAHGEGEVTASRAVLCRSLLNPLALRHHDSPQLASPLSNVKSVFRNPTPRYSTNNGHVLHSASRADNRVTVVCLPQQFRAFSISVTMT